MNGWKKVGPYIRFDDIWSTPDFHPSQKDVRGIFEVQFQDCEVGIAHACQRIRYFKVEHDEGVSVSFLRAGPLFLPGHDELSDYDKALITLKRRGEGDVVEVMERFGFWNEDPKALKRCKERLKILSKYF